MRKTCQEDFVREDLEMEKMSRTKRVAPPGIQELHKRPLEDIAQTFINLFRSQVGVTAIKWNVGENFEITYDP